MQRDLSGSVTSVPSRRIHFADVQTEQLDESLHERSTLHDLTSVSEVADDLIVSYCRLRLKRAYLSIRFVGLGRN